MNDTFCHCTETPHASSSGDCNLTAMELDKPFPNVVSLQGAEESSGRADVPLVGTVPQSDENPGNKPHQDYGASEGI